MSPNRTALKILLVVNYFPPASGGGRAYRAAKLVKHFSRAGCLITIVCSDASLDPDDTLLAGLDMSRVQVLRCQEPSGPINKALSRLCRQLLIADGQYMLAWRLLDKILKSQIGYIPDLVITSSWPYEVHAVGFILQQMFGIKWVADFRDPYTLNLDYGKLNPVSRYLDRVFENIVYHKADGTVFNTLSNKNESCASFKLDSDAPRYIVVQNGYDPEDQLSASKTRGNGRFFVSYIGGVRGSAIERTFVNLILKHVSYLNDRKVVFRLIGNGSEVFIKAAARSAGALEVIGFCSQAHLRDYWESSNALLLLLPHCNDYLGWVPQKVYSYLASKHKILAIVPNGEARDYLLQDPQHVIRDPHDKDLPSMIDELLDTRTNYPTMHPFSDRFSQHKLFGCLLEWLEGIADK